MQKKKKKKGIIIYPKRKILQTFLLLKNPFQCGAALF